MGWLSGDGSWLSGAGGAEPSDLKTFVKNLLGREIREDGIVLPPSWGNWGREKLELRGAEVVMLGDREFFGVGMGDQPVRQPYPPQDGLLFVVEPEIKAALPKRHDLITPDEFKAREGLVRNNWGNGYFIRELPPILYREKEVIHK